MITTPASSFALNGKRKSVAATSISSKSVRLDGDMPVKSTETDDFVAVVGNAKVDSSNVSFRAHKFKGRHNVFSINDVGTVDVKHVGTAERSADGLEYYLAFVNKRTGLAEAFRPASVVKFQPKYQPVELGMSAEEPDQVNNSPPDGDFASRRRNLTAEFGSIKKNKFLDNTFRRQVDEHTLAAITPAVLTGSGATAGDESRTDAGGGLETLTSSQADDSFGVSLLNKAASDVLPPPNYAATKPADVYTLDLFFPKSPDDNASGMLESEALEFFKKYSSVEALTEIEVPRLLANRINNIFEFKKPGKRACVACKAIVMARIVKEFGEKLRVIDQHRVMPLYFPPNITALTISEFLTTITVKKKTRVQLNNRSRLFAHFLCILLLFDNVGFTIPMASLIEFNLTEAVTMRLLRGLGCDVVAATPEEQRLYNSMRMARLVGPPRHKSTPRRGRQSMK